MNTVLTSKDFMDPSSINISVLGLSFSSERSRLLAEDEGETILYNFYDFLSPRIAKRLKLIDTKSNTSEEETLSETLTIWRQVSRSATLALLDALLENTRTKTSLSSDAEWVDQCKGSLDLKKFKSETSLEGKDALAALEEAAVAFIEYFKTPETPKRFFYKGYLIENT